jgi:HSP20 family protein
MAFEMKPFNNSLFDMVPGDVFKDFGRQFFQQFPEGYMKSDIRELENSYVVEAELPGIDKDNINIEFDNGVLTIEGKQSSSNEEKDDTGRVIHSERNYSNFKRQFSFGEIDEENISANFDNGILKISLPKTETNDKSKRIEIS